MKSFSPQAPLILPRGAGTPGSVPQSRLPFCLPPCLSVAEAAQMSLLPYFQTVMEHLMGYLLTTREDLRAVQIQSVGEPGRVVLCRVAV